MSAGAGQVSGPLSRIVRDSHLKYLGLTLVLAWHYCLWFVPSAFPTTFLLDDRITFSWLIALAAAGVVPLALAGWLGRNRHLEARPSLVWPVSVMGSVATMTLSSAGMLAAAPWVAYAAAFFTFGLTDFREAHTLQSWLIWLKVANLAILLWLRATIIGRYYPSSKLY